MTIRFERNKKNFVEDLDLQLVQPVHTRLDFTRPRRVEYMMAYLTLGSYIESNQVVFCVIEAIPMAAVVRRRKEQACL